MKKYILLYDDGSHKIHLNKLVDTAKQYSDFEIIVFEKKDIDPTFVAENINILQQPRGGGYWLWKSYIINKVLHQINEGDYVFYIDAKYYFLENFTKLYE